MLSCCVKTLCGKPFVAGFYDVLEPHSHVPCQLSQIQYLVVYMVGKPITASVNILGAMLPWTYRKIAVYQLSCVGTREAKGQIGCCMGTPLPSV